MGIYIALRFHHPFAGSPRCDARTHVRNYSTTPSIGRRPVCTTPTWHAYRPARQLTHVQFVCCPFIS
eukprot:5130806-Pleurochrysis_carterae.AAC.3